MHRCSSKSPVSKCHPGVSGPQPVVETNGGRARCARQEGQVRSKTFSSPRTPTHIQHTNRTPNSNTCSLSPYPICFTSLSLHTWAQTDTDSMSRAWCRFTDENLRVASTRRGTPARALPPPVLQRLLQRSIDGVRWLTTFVGGDADGYDDYSGSEEDESHSEEEDDVCVCLPRFPHTRHVPHLLFPHAHSLCSVRTLGYRLIRVMFLISKFFLLKC